MAGTKSKEERAPNVCEPGPATPGLKQILPHGNRFQNKHYRFATRGRNHSQTESLREVRPANVRVDFCELWSPAKKRTPNPGGGPSLTEEADQASSQQ